MHSPSLGIHDDNDAASLLPAPAPAATLTSSTSSETPHPHHPRPVTRFCFGETNRNPEAAAVFWSLMYATSIGRQAVGIQQVESGVGVDEVRLRSPPTPTAVAATSTALRVGVVRVGVIVVGLTVILSDLPMVNLHAVELDNVLPPHYVVYLLVELDDVLTPHYVVYLLDLKLLPFSMIGKEGNASIAGMADFERDRCNRRNRTRWRYEGVGVAGGAPGCTLSTGS